MMSMQVFLFVLVQKEVTREAKVGRLLDELEHCGPNAFDSFKRALEETDQPYAVAAINETLTGQQLSNIHPTSDGSVLLLTYSTPIHTAS